MITVSLSWNVLGQKYECLIHVGAVGILCGKTQKKNTFWSLSYNFLQPPVTSSLSVPITLLHMTFSHSNEKHTLYKKWKQNAKNEDYFFKQHLLLLGSPVKLPILEFAGFGKHLYNYKAY